MTGWSLLQRADARRRLLDLFVHGVLRSFRWWPRSSLATDSSSTLDDSLCFLSFLCFLWFLSHRSFLLSL